MSLAFEVIDEECIGLGVFADLGYNGIEIDYVLFVGLDERVHDYNNMASVHLF